VDGVTIYYEENAQVEIINSAGTRVLIDVYRPGLLSAPPTEKDILLTTHTHQDHYNSSFVKTFPGTHVIGKEEVITLPDMTIRSIASAHNEPAKLVSEGANNYIFVVDMEGLRIAHFGDIGQDALTQDQLDALGKVDIAITQFDNSFSSMNATNQKGFNLMEQVQPRLIIPTHNSQKTTQIAVEKWRGFATDQKSVTVTADDLRDETQILFMGMLAPAYQKIFQLSSWESRNNTASCDECIEHMKILNVYTW
jgi:L-ascorbate metabolism protein UlaG (beta-lactamase superfamily)